MKKGFFRPRYELVIVILVLLASVAVSFGLGAKRDIIVKGRLMTLELSAMRSAILTYKLINRQNPASLTALTSSVFSFSPSEEARAYVTGLTSDDGGPVDPFGVPYTYDKVTGRVHSESNGFRNW